MAQRIDVSSAKFPPATADLFDAMGREAYAAMADHYSAMSTDEEKSPYPAWERQTETVRNAWAVSARAMYAEMARRGGGKISRVE